MLTAASPEVSKPTLCPSKMKALEKLNFHLLCLLTDFWSTGPDKGSPWFD